MQHLSHPTQIPAKELAERLKSDEYHDLIFNYIFTPFEVKTLDPRRLSDLCLYKILTIKFIRLFGKLKGLATILHSYTQRRNAASILSTLPGGTQIYSFNLNLVLIIFI